MKTLLLSTVAAVALCIGTAQAADLVTGTVGITAGSSANAVSTVEAPSVWFFPGSIDDTTVTATAAGNVTANDVDIKQSGVDMLQGNLGVVLGSSQTAVAGAKAEGLGSEIDDTNIKAQAIGTEGDLSANIKQAGVDALRLNLGAGIYNSGTALAGAEASEVEDTSVTAIQRGVVLSDNVNATQAGVEVLTASIGVGYENSGFAAAGVKAIEVEDVEVVADARDVQVGSDQTYTYGNYEVANITAGVSIGNSSTAGASIEAANVEDSSVSAGAGNVQSVNNVAVKYAHADVAQINAGVVLGGSATSIANVTAHRIDNVSAGASSVNNLQSSTTVFKGVH